MTIKVNEHKQMASKGTSSRAQELITSCINPDGLQQSSSNSQAGRQGLVSKSSNYLHSSSVYRQLMPSSKQVNDNQSLYLQPQARPMSIDKRLANGIYKSRSLDFPPVGLVSSPTSRPQDNHRQIMASPKTNRPAGTTRTEGSLMHHSLNTSGLNISTSYAGSLSRQPTSTTPSNFIQTLCRQSGISDHYHREYLVPHTVSQTPKSNHPYMSRPEATMIATNSNSQQSFFSVRQETEPRNT